MDYAKTNKQLSQQEKDWHTHNQFGQSKKKISHQANLQLTGMQSIVIVANIQDHFLIFPGINNLL